MERVLQENQAENRFVQSSVWTVNTQLREPILIVLYAPLRTDRVHWPIGPCPLVAVEDGFVADLVQWHTLPVDGTVFVFRVA